MGIGLSTTAHLCVYACMGLVSLKGVVIDVLGQWISSLVLCELTLHHRVTVSLTVVIPSILLFHHHRCDPKDVNKCVLCYADEKVR